MLAQNFVPGQQRLAIRCTMSLSAKQTGKTLKTSPIVADTFAVDVPLLLATISRAMDMGTRRGTKVHIASLRILGPETRGAVVSIVGLGSAMQEMAFSLAFPGATSWLLTRVV